MPWYSKEIDLVSNKQAICCWLDTKHPITRQELQQAFMTTDFPLPCNQCWQLEHQNIESRREMENRFLDHKMDRDIGSIEADAESGLAETNLYQIFVGSTCNGTCVTCGPNASSAWRSLSGRKVVSIRQENQKADSGITELLDPINWKTAKRFNFLGGEPLLIDRSFYILHRLIEAENTDCRISFVTNGSVALTKTQVELCKHFSDINACVSIDGIGPAFEYIRYPLRWDTLLNNLAVYREVFSEVTVSFTISNLNYADRETIIHWFQQQQLPYIENYVSYPPWFNHAVSPGHALWPKFVDTIREQDRLKNISIKDYIPRISQLIDHNT
jgi:MoaA/NifB/PqqE/SkfB family radical SAM enzyme